MTLLARAPTQVAICKLRVQSTALVGAHRGEVLVHGKAVRADATHPTTAHSTSPLAQQDRGTRGGGVIDSAGLDADVGRDELTAMSKRSRLSAGLGMQWFG